MFQKADGTRTWLLSEHHLPYLCIEGLFVSDDDYTQVRRRLLMTFKTVVGLGQCDLFVVDEWSPTGSILFSPRPDGTCAIILTGEVNVDIETGENPSLHAYLDKLEEDLEYVQSSGQIKIEIKKLCCQAAARAA